MKNNDELLNLHDEPPGLRLTDEDRQRYDLLRAYCEENIRFGIALRRALDGLMQ